LKKKVTKAEMLDLDHRDHNPYTLIQMAAVMVQPLALFHELEPSYVFAGYCTVLHHKHYSVTP
jgi:hypothetical protein